MPEAVEEDILEEDILEADSPVVEVDSPVAGGGTPVARWDHTEEELYKEKTNC